MTLDQKLLLVWEYEGGPTNSQDRQLMEAFRSYGRPGESTPRRGEASALQHAAPRIHHARFTAPAMAR